MVFAITIWHAVALLIQLWVTGLDHFVINVKMDFMDLLVPQDVMLPVRAIIEGCATWLEGAHAMTVIHLVILLVQVAPPV